MSELTLAIFFFTAASLELERTPWWRPLRRARLHAECDRWWQAAREYAKP